MKSLTELLDSNALWKAEDTTRTGKDSAILSNCELTKGEATTINQVLQHGTLHEFFYEYQDELTPHPPIALTTLLSRALLVSNKSKQGAFQRGKSSGGSNNQKLFIWIGREVWPTPFFIKDCFCAEDTLSFGLTNSLFIDVANEKERIWAIETALGSASVGAVVSLCSKLSFAATQKFLLLTKQSKVLAFLFRSQKEKHVKSAAQSRWHIRPTTTESESPCWKLSLLHTKSSYPEQRSWTVETQFIHSTLLTFKQSEDASERDQHEENIRFNILPGMVSKPIPETIGNYGYMRRAS